MTPAKGYIFSRSFFGQRVPQRVQNIVVRDFAAQKQFNVSFSSVEYCHTGSTAILESLLDAALPGEVIIFYSVFQFPEQPGTREKLYKVMSKKRVTIHTALEGLIISDSESIQKLESLIAIKGYHTVVEHTLLSNILDFKLG